jgi:hypothetical protein
MACATSRLSHLRTRGAARAAPGKRVLLYDAARTHFTASSRAYHWKAVKAAAGWKGDLYLATRHFAGWYMSNRLRLSPEDTAVALGHTDGGQLVRTLYGHLDEEAALERVNEAFQRQADLTRMRTPARRRRRAAIRMGAARNRARSPRSDRPRDDPRGPQ